MSRHTSGKWFDRPGSVYTETTIEITGGTGERVVIATLYKTEDGSMDKNAALITAAPELLEACKGLLETAKRYHGIIYTSQGFGQVETIMKAIKVIAKAEGSEK